MLNSEYAHYIKHSIKNTSFKNKSWFFRQHWYPWYLRWNSDSWRILGVLRGHQCLHRFRRILCSHDRKRFEAESKAPEDQKIKFRTPGKQKGCRVDGCAGEKDERNDFSRRPTDLNCSVEVHSPLSGTYSRILILKKIWYPDLTS